MPVPDSPLQGAPSGVPGASPGPDACLASGPGRRYRFFKRRSPVSGVVLSACLLLMTPLLAPSSALAADSSATLTQKKQASEADLKRLKHEIQAMQGELKATAARRSDTRNGLEKIERQLNETRQQTGRLEDERDDITQQLTRLTRQRETLIQQQTAQKAAVAEEMAALYRLGRQPELKLLLNQDDPARLERLQVYLNHLSDSRRQALERLARLDASLASTRASLLARQTRLEEVQQGLKQQASKLMAQQNERAALLRTLDARYASHEAKIAELDQDRAHANQMIQTLEKRLKAIKSAPPPRTRITRAMGKMDWPAPGRVISAYGGGEGVNRDGVLIQASQGTPVTAPHAGRVVFADWMRGYGNLLIIDHGDNVLTLYAHLASFSVGPGDSLSRGQQLGSVGSSGGRDGAALYFEVRRAGKPVNPQRWLSSR
ncbi:peptidase M23 [Cobetia sp. ICG0124]|nr:peptidase M23 [Cobetia sp. ICG0124]